VLFRSLGIATAGIMTYVVAIVGAIILIALLRIVGVFK
jgi:hypothetical protein